MIVGAPKGNPVFGPLAHVIKIRLAALRASQKIVFFIAKFNREDMVILKEMLESGKVRPVIDQTFPFHQTAEALRYLGTGHARAKVVVTMA